MSNAAEALARSHARDAKMRETMHKLKANVLRKALVTTGAAGYGALKRHKVPNDVKGFPWKLGLWTVFTTAEVFAKGYLQTAAGALGDTTLAVYTHDAVAEGTLIAGNGDSAQV
jgi:hypothetical protein